MRVCAFLVFGMWKAGIGRSKERSSSASVRAGKAD